MYAKVNLEVETRENVLLVPKIALVDSEGQRGVYQANDDKPRAVQGRSRSASKTPTAPRFSRASPKARPSCRRAPARCAATTSSLIAGAGRRARRSPGAAVAGPGRAGPGRPAATAARAAGGRRPARPAGQGGQAPTAARTLSERRPQSPAKQRCIDRKHRRLRPASIVFGDHRMSIPRLAIHRPVTMFMISFVVMLLGRHLADPAAGRSDAGERVPEHHRPRQLLRRRAARDGGARHAAARAGGLGDRRSRTGQLDLVRRQQPTSGCSSPGAPT